jgi:hypothetical protein
MEAGFEGFELLLLWNAIDALAEPALRASYGAAVFPEAAQTPEAANARPQAEIRAIRETGRAMRVQPEE